MTRLPPLPIRLGDIVLSQIAAERQIGRGTIVDDEVGVAADDPFDHIVQRVDV
jgi:hypothetical protein